MCIIAKFIYIKFICIYGNCSHFIVKANEATITSTVFPFIALSTSPGLTAVPDGIFSVNAIIPTMLISNPSLEAASMAATVHAAPPMSPFISAILAEGFIDIPPL